MITNFLKSDTCGQNTRRDPALDTRRARMTRCKALTGQKLRGTRSFKQSAKYGSRKGFVLPILARSLYQYSAITDDKEREHDDG